MIFDTLSLHRAQVWMNLMYLHAICEADGGALLGARQIVGARVRALAARQRRRRARPAVRAAHTQLARRSARLVLVAAC